MIKNLDKFICEFPGCDYETDCRNKIHLHHIKPREIGGTNRTNSTIFYK